MVATEMRDRTARQCRDRYRNYLNPQLRHGGWTRTEDALLKRLYEEHGGKWGVIAKSFKDRSEIGLRNRYYTIAKRRFGSSGSEDDGEEESVMDNSDEEVSEKTGEKVAGKMGGRSAGSAMSTLTERSFCDESGYYY